ncbi:MAG: hypothetical protein KAH20_15600 [Methylococcales bacterium]|nr:hypothetical protein [Methylococcales bacterium]
MVTIFFLTSCAVYKIQDATKPFDMNAKWIMLPMINHSDTPDAGASASDIAATLIRSRGITQLASYDNQADSKKVLELDQNKQLTEAINWAKQQDYNYGLSGSVQEWRYKSGLDGEPATGITLTVIDLDSGQTVWSASGSRTGWGRESVSGVAHKLLAILIDGLGLR